MGENSKKVEQTLITFMEMFSIPKEESEEHSSLEIILKSMSSMLAFIS